MGKTHWSWHVNWKLRLALFLLIITMVIMCAVLGPIAIWALREDIDLLKDSVK
jgi:uncharacterized Tic20 family protein